MTYLQLNNKAAAKESFLRVMKMGGDKRGAAEQLAHLSFEAGETSKAKRYFDLYTKNKIKEGILS